jgi:hypothetical protein
MHESSIAVLSVLLCGAFGCGSTGSGPTAASKQMAKANDPMAKAQASAGKGGSSGSGASDGSRSATASDAGNAGNAGRQAQAGDGGSPAASATDAGTGAASDAAGSSPMPMSLVELPDAFAGSVCAALGACVGPSVVRELTQREDCTVRVAAELRATEFAYIDQAVSEGHVAYDPSQLPACMDGIRALGCDVLSHSLPQACSAVLAGNVQLGDECAISAECAGAAFCAGTDQCPSHCAALLGEGDACSGDNQCGDDLLCADAHCLRPSRDGDPCNGMSGKLCRIGFTCQDSTDVDTGHCVPNAMVQVGDVGDACTPGGSLCKDGLSCVYSQGSVFHCEQAVGSGASCHLGLPGQCSNVEYCDTTDVTAQSVCKALPSEGQACVLSGLCAPGLVCVAEGQGHDCRPIQDNCGACGSDSECRSSHCDQGKCAPPPACGEAFSCP